MVGIDRRRNIPGQGGLRTFFDPALDFDLIAGCISAMAWRLAEHVTHGEIDNTVRGRIVGKIWFEGLEEPMVLDLEGDARRDLAGCRLVFQNPSPVALRGDLPDPRQNGIAVEVTASRKVKVPECTVEEMMDLSRQGLPFPWHWANALRIEWFCSTNGRVLVESATFRMEISPDKAWEMDEEEEARSMESAANAIAELDPANHEEAHAEDADLFDEDDLPQSAAEAEADMEAARMDLLIDRVNERMMEGDFDEDDWDRIYEEERERLRIESGEPEPEPLTAEEMAERESWLEEMNAIAEEAMENFEAGTDPDFKPHPLVEKCSALAMMLASTVNEVSWLDPDESLEHPLHTIVDGVQIASAKLAGALNTAADEEWPPEPRFAGHTLNRLKTARGHLREALTAIRVSEKQGLAPSRWLEIAAQEARIILGQVNELIDEVRRHLEEAERGNE
jgi:hypothetical protein